MFSNKEDLGDVDYEVKEIEEELLAKDPSEYDVNRCYWICPNKKWDDNKYKKLLLGLPGAGAQFLKRAMPSNANLIGCIFDHNICYANNNPEILHTKNTGVLFYEIQEEPNVLICISEQKPTRPIDENTLYIHSIFSKIRFDACIVLGDIFLTTLGPAYKNHNPPFLFKLETPNINSELIMPDNVTPHLDPMILITGCAADAICQANTRNISARLYLTLRNSPIHYQIRVEEIIAYHSALSNLFNIRFKTFDQIINSFSALLKNTSYMFI